MFAYLLSSIVLILKHHLMAQDNGEKPELMLNTVPESKRVISWPLLILRIMAFSATASATIVMGMNKETKSLVVATIGNTPIEARLTAKFQHTPAFVFFVVANGMVSIHNLLMITIELFGGKFDYKGIKFLLIAILDMMTVALASGGDSAATFMAALGKYGNSHARWNKICDKFQTFCDHGGGAIIASYVGLFLLVVITALSILRLLKPKRTNYTVIP